jgi:hypothetical protein
VDEDRPTDDNQRGDALTPRPDAAGGGDAAAGSESLPSSVRLRLDSCAADWVREYAVRSARQSRTGWFVAAACLLLAVAGWWPRLGTLAHIEDVSTVSQFNADWSRQHLLDVGGKAVRRWPWSTAEGSAPGVSGDVVWDNAKQVGFLTFVGLEPNQPLRHQYQLWIVDASRDERYPVDGGVFDVPATGAAVVIPVRASVPVREPLAFVVTVEKPGGAVVSARERVVAVARPTAN